MLIPDKGTLGYIDATKKDSLIKGVIGFCVFILVFIIGNLISGSSKNMGSIFAVLLALPTAQQFTRYFGYRRYKSLSTLEHLSDSVINDALYELLVVRGKKNCYIDVACYRNKKLYLLINHSHNYGQDINDIRQAIQSMMNQKGLKLNTECYEDVHQYNQVVVDVVEPASEEMELVYRSLLWSAM